MCVGKVTIFLLQIYACPRNLMRKKLKIPFFLANFADRKPQPDYMKLFRNDNSRPKYRLGVALSGGGARGFAHAGALLALEHAGLRPDVIAGVSAGSVVAVMYAAGVEPIAIAQHFATSGVRDFTELALGSGGLVSIDKFGDHVLSALGGITRIEELRIPTYIGATDLDAGKPVVFSGGEIKPRMLASCSIPIVFRPVEIDGVNYVDGGVLRNHPAWLIRDKCRVLIGVNVSPLIPEGEYKSIVRVALRTYNLMSKANQDQDMAMCDISIQTPEIADMAPFDLKHIKDAFMSGYIQTRKALIDAGLWKHVPKPDQKDDSATPDQSSTLKE